MVIPISDLDEFIDDNLDPIGIIVDDVKNDDTLYELSDVFEGWMRFDNDYAAFAEKDFINELPKELDEVLGKHDVLLKKGYDIGIQLDNTETSLEERRDGFANFRENVLAGVKKRPDETKKPTPCATRTAKTRSRRWSRSTLSRRTSRSVWSIDKPRGMKRRA